MNVNSLHSDSVAEAANALYETAKNTITQVSAETEAVFSKLSVLTDQLKLPQNILQLIGEKLHPLDIRQMLYIWYIYIYRVVYGIFQLTTTASRISWLRRPERHSVRQSAPIVWDPPKQTRNWLPSSSRKPTPLSRCDTELTKKLCPIS